MIWAGVRELEGEGQEKPSGTDLLKMAALEPRDREAVKLRPGTPGSSPFDRAQRPSALAVRFVRCLSTAPAQWAAARGAEAL